MPIKNIIQLWLKPTSDSKHETDLEIDDAIDKLNFILPAVYHLLNFIIKRKIKRFFTYSWKPILRSFIIILFSCSVIYLSVDFLFKSYIEPYCISLFSKKEKKDTTIVIYEAKLKSFEDFENAVGQQESGNNWGIKNKFGMLGRYQFSPATLKEYVGINVPDAEFLSNKDLQRGAFIYFLKKNKKTYGGYIYRWNMRKIKNVQGTVTESGILMAFHLRPESAKEFFDSNGNILGKPDGNGIFVNAYIEQFSGYDIPSYLND